MASNTKADGVNIKSEYDKVDLTVLLKPFKVFNKTNDVMCYVFNNMNRIDNTLVHTYKKISEELNVSIPTVAGIMKRLQAIDLVRKVQNGVWMINPRILCRGDLQKQMYLIRKYDEHPSYYVRQLKNDKKEEDANKVS